MGDHYRTLGIGRDASDRDVKAAFRRLARRYHPDLNPGDEAAEGRFKEINEAYEVLADPESRGRYDAYGDGWRHADRMGAAGFGRGGPGFGGGWDPFGAGGFDLSDLLGGRGGGRAGATRRVEVSAEVTLEEAFAGTSRRMGVPGTAPPRTIEVSIPPGVRSGTPVVVTPAEGLEVLLRVKVAAHHRYRRRGDDLLVDASVPFEVAALGGEAQVETMTGVVMLTIPPASGTGRRIRLSGRGMPVLGTPDRRGDLIVTVRPTVPGDLTDEQRGLLEAYRRSRASMDGSAARA